MAEIAQMRKPQPNTRGSWRGCEILIVGVFFIAIPIAFGFGLTALESSLSNIDTNKVGLPKNLSAAQAKSFDLLTGLINTFIGWDIAVIGAAFFFLKFIEREQKIPSVHIITACIVSVVALAAIFFGQMAIDAIQFALWQELDPRKSGWIVGLVNYHWTLTVVGAAMFVAHAVYFILKRRG